MMQNINSLLDKIKCPSSEFSPIPFWFLNDHLEEKELKRQLTDFKEKGVDAVVLHPRIGIPKELPYLSNEYLNIIRYIVATAAELKMRIVLYDEAMYPSGSAHGEVVKANPEFASIGITLTAKPENKKIIAALDDGNYIIQDYSGGTIRGIHFGEDDGEENAPPSADILNPGVVDKFIQLTHERHYQYLKDYFGNTIIGYFTDEPCVLGRCTSGFFEWTDGLESDIIAAGGNLKDLEGLFTGGNNSTIDIYRSVVKHRLNDTYYKKLFYWCEAHGIALMGHPESSDDIDQEAYFHIPGQDLIQRLVSPEKGGLYGTASVQAKCSSDAARHTGKRRNSNECFGVCARSDHPWHLTGGDMKWFIDWLGVRGVNMFIPHAFYYSIRGKRSDERPPDVGPNNIWWEYYRRFSDYMKRVSSIMTDSVNCAKVAVICESGNMPADEMLAFYENQIEFNYLPSSLLNNYTGDTLSINGYQYPYYMAESELNLPAKRISSVDEITDRDFLPSVPCKDLRVSHVIKNKTDMYFFTNEGEEDIRIDGTVPVSGVPIYVNLWDGKHWEREYCGSSNRSKVSLSLAPRDSILILFNTSGGIVGTAAGNEDIINLCFTQVTEDSVNCKKVYVGEYTSEQVTGHEVFSVRGDEMIECYCNGEFVDVSFWNLHKFHIGHVLKKGQNEIRLVVSGSIANMINSGAVPYGLL